MRAQFQKYGDQIIHAFADQDRQAYLDLLPDDSHSIYISKSKNRRKLTKQKVADLVAMVTQSSFKTKSKTNQFHQCRTSRKGTVKLSKELKRLGLVDWSCNRDIYRQLIDVAIEYGLLKEYAPAIRPSGSAEGSGALIAPGPNHPLHMEWLRFAVSLGLIVEGMEKVMAA